MNRDARLAVLVAHQVGIIDTYFGGMDCTCGADFNDSGSYREDYVRHLADVLDESPINREAMIVRALDVGTAINDAPNPREQAEAVIDAIIDGPDFDGKQVAVGIMKAGQWLREQKMIGL